MSINLAADLIPPLEFLAPQPRELVAGDYRGTPAAWNAFVREQSAWTPFHFYGWRTVIERVFPHECRYLAACDASGQIHGVLPLVRVKSRLFGHYLVSVPFVNYGGPLGTPEAIRLLSDHALELAKAGGVDLLEFRSRTALPLDLPVSHRKITVVLDLPAGSPEVLWRALPAKVRSQIRRPQKEGVEVRFGEKELDGFYHVFARHMRDLGTPVQSRAFFEALQETFPEDIWFGCAYYRGEPVAAGAGFRWGSEFEMTWASSLAEHNRIAPNMLLYWSFMERCVEQGVTLFNFGRCTPDSGTHRFKQQWGSRDETLWWYHVASGTRSATPSPKDGAFSLGPRLWRRLPLGIANVIGPRIVQYIP